MTRAMLVLGLLLVGCGDDLSSQSLTAAAPLPECPPGTTVPGVVTYCIACTLDSSTAPNSCNNCHGIDCYKHDSDGRYYIQAHTAPGNECVISTPDITGAMDHVSANGNCPGQPNTPL